MILEKETLKKELEKLNKQYNEILTSIRKNKKNQAQALCDKYNASKAVVKSKKVKKDTIKPGKLQGFYCPDRK